MLTFTVYSQPMPVKKIAKIKLPRNCKRLTLANKAILEISKSEKSILHISRKKTGEYYEVGNFVLRLLAAEGKKDLNHLEDLIAFNEEYNPKKPMENIQSFPTFKVLVIFTEYDTIGKYSFFAVDNTSGTKYLNGQIEFLKDEKQEARKVLDNFIQGIRFK